MAEAATAARTVMEQATTVVGVNAAMEVAVTAEVEGEGAVGRLKKKIEEQAGELEAQGKEHEEEIKRLQEELGAKKGEYAEAQETVAMQMRLLTEAKAEARREIGRLGKEIDDFIEAHSVLERVLEKVVGEKVSAEDDLARSQGEVLALGARIEDLATRATRRMTGSEVRTGESSPSFVSEQLTNW